MKSYQLLSALVCCFVTIPAVHAEDWVTYPAKDGPGQGKHLVFLSGDEEYRSEEGLPQLAKILSQRHGFKCTVLFAVDKNGAINPDINSSLPGAAALDSADAIVILLRYRNYPDAAMKHFSDAYLRGVPIIGLRTATHAFNMSANSSYKNFTTFGKRVLGEGWVNHWGKHKQEATRGIIEPGAANDPLLRGVADVFGDTDVYEAYPPADVKILLRGQVLKGMKPTGPPADYQKKRQSDKMPQGINDPMMPIAWTRLHKNEAGKENKVFCTTMGASTDLLNEGLRRLVVNAVYWGLNMDVPAKADVAVVGDYKPTMYGNKGYKKGIKPAELALQAPPLQIRTGDHITIIGNALADRMQHDGWLETYIYSRFPQQNLVFRNLGFGGDEVKTRIRSANFGSPDVWLTKTKTDVVFAFFGYNESFAGDDGLPAFKKELANFISRTLAQKYNGQSAPRLVLFSPIAHENLHDRNLPDGSANNARLEKYTAAMAEVAKDKGIGFVDLFHPTLELYAKNSGPLTVNGLFLNERGNQLVAEIIDKALFGERPAKDNPALLEKIRQAVLDRNFYWFNRYRTLDGYNVYGGRSTLKFVDGQTNFVVMQREMEMLDIMTANRDQRVWAVAKGGDLKVDDSNLPAHIPVPTNIPGPLPGGAWPYLDGEEAIKKMTLAKGLKVNLFASEKEFPELINPVQMAWDTKGRLWVAVWPSYPHWKPGDPLDDKLLVFEDTKGTGKADKCTVFADHLNCPTGFEFYNGGVLLAQAPDLIFLKDTNGTGKADVRLRILHGLDSADSHHTANSFTLDPGGALYFQEGTFHHTQVENLYGPPVINKNAGVFRYEPRTQKFEVYVNVPFANPHGHVFDRWGQDIIMDGTGANPYHGTLFSGQTANPDQRHPTAGANLAIYKPKTRPCPGVEILSSRHFPESMQGTLLVPNVIGFLGIMQYKLSDAGALGASFTGTEMDYIIRSSDPNFRPSDLKIGPDGAIYFADWQNHIIGHMQHHIRDPNRGHEHGRIYRITCENQPLLTPVKIDGEPIAKLLDVLKEPEDRVRYRARIELGGRDTNQVMAAVKTWIQALDPKDKDYEHHMMEALWLHQNHNVVNEELLKRMLRSPDFHARAAATRVLCNWRDQVKDPLELLRVQINDTHGRVRLEAIRALSFFHSEAALAVAVELLAAPVDKYLQFTFNETLNTLERRLSAGKLNRNNIAASLLVILNTGKLDAQRKSTLIEAICRNGSAKELQAIWDKALDPQTLGLDLRSRALVWLADAAATRKVQPAVPADQVLLVLKEGDTPILPDALRLAAAWKVKEATDTFNGIARNVKMSQQARFAAMDGLAALGDPASVKSLLDLTAKDNPLAIQFHAAEALALVDLEAGAKAAAASLALPDQYVDPGSLIQAFLNRKDGSDKLAAALAKHQLSADTAKRILRSMIQAGRSDAGLANVISTFAGLDAALNLPTAAEIQQLTLDVMAKGDAARGEHIFRRPDLGCMKCHAVNKVGGNIGPDLGPIGGSSPLDYIITSVLDPSASIKEEYLTKVITTTTGQIVTGIVVERNKSVVVLKDATGKLLRIATADIDQEQNGKSLMPEGITRTLTRPELLDLLRFVSELGKPGPYAARTSPAVQRFKWLHNPAMALAEGVPNREVLRDSILAATPDAWEIVYGTVSGKLPLEDLLKPGKPRVVYLQAEVVVTKAGAVDVVLDGGAKAVFWVDEDQFDQPNATVQLSAGRHRITIRAVVGATPTPPLSLELRKPKNSKAAFEIVQMD